MAWYFDELDDKLKKIADELPEIFEGMEVVAATSVKGSHRKRLDNGNPKKKYKSSAYKKIRENKGRQTAYIDMQLTGEFVRSMKVGTDNGSVVYGVQNLSVGKTDTSTIFKGQVERNKHGDILKINDEEIRKGIEAAKSYFNKQIKDLFAQFK
jgi:hypothetical protein